MPATSAPRSLLIAPHNDDETLFAAFTIMRVKPVVAIVLDSYLQPFRGHQECTWLARRLETEAALDRLVGIDKRVQFLEHRDDRPDWNLIGHHLRHIVPVYDHIYFPALEKGGHEHHNAVSIAARVAVAEFGKEFTCYKTYTTEGKSTGKEVPVESGEWVRRKLQALSCYRTQIDNALLGCRPHFMRDLTEYYA